MTQEEFFKLALTSEISGVGLSSAGRDKIVSEYLDRYKRNQFNGKPSTLLSEIRVEAKKRKKLEGNKVERKRKGGLND